MEAWQWRPLWKAIHPNTTSERKDEIEKQLLNLLWSGYFYYGALMAVPYQAPTFEILSIMTKHPNTRETVLLTLELMLRIPSCYSFFAFTLSIGP